MRSEIIIQALLGHNQVVFIERWSHYRGQKYNTRTVRKFHFNSANLEHLHGYIVSLCHNFRTSMRGRWSIQDHLEEEGGRGGEGRGEERGEGRATVLHHNDSLTCTTERRSPCCSAGR